MISEAQTLGNHAQIRKIYKTALYVFLTIGIVGSLGMFFFSKPLSVLVSNSETSWAAIAALAPCVLIICMISAYRGFFQGQSNMAPTSSQPDLRGHHPPRHRPEPRLAAHV